VNKQTVLPAPVAVAAPVTTYASQPFYARTTVCANGQCTTVPAGYATGYAAQPGFTYYGPSYATYSVPGGYGFGAGGSCGVQAGGYTFRGRIRGGGCN